MTLLERSSDGDGVARAVVVTLGAAGAAVVAPGAPPVDLPARNVTTYTGDAWISSWPKPFTSLGGGWSTGQSTARDVLDTALATAPLADALEKHVALLGFVGDADPV